MPNPTKYQRSHSFILQTIAGPPLNIELENVEHR